MIVLKTEPLATWAIEDELMGFEQRYGVSSDRLMEAFVVDGELVESPDFRRWMHVWTLRRALVPR